ncbi:MAG: hypothetical protein KBS68_05075 [Clostridiales bacterium]|nr:hypothetical protein [Candidatus Crickella merdequi]
MSVGFADKDEDYYVSQNYIVDESPMGKVYYPATGAMQTGDIGVRYEVKPWISAFYVDGLRALPALRLGMGTKSPKYFVELLSNIYPKAFDEYKANKNAEMFFMNANDWFLVQASDTLLRMYIGFVENVWREGNGKMLGVAEQILRSLASDSRGRVFLEEGITEEFAKSDFLKKIV